MSLEENCIVSIATPGIIALNYCWSFRNIIQDRINNGILKFPKKKEAMVIHEDSFPPVTSINIVATNLRAFLNAKKVKRFSPSARISNVWIPK